MIRSLSPATRHRVSFLLPLFFLLALTVTAHAEDNESQVHEFNLDNGLKVLVKQDKRAPVAVIQVWYKVGTSYEHEGITGLSHALEHMMFKGTKTRKSGEFEKLVSAIGARNNAFTSQDYTAYYEVLANDKLEQAIEIEADRMRNLVLMLKNLKKKLKWLKKNVA